MKVQIEKMNSLPVPTWRWLGVNQTSVALNMAQAKPLQNTQPTLPQGICIAKNAGPAFNGMQTSAGADAQAFIAKNRNITINLQAQSSAVKSTAVIYQYELAEDMLSVVDDTTIYALPNSEITVVMVYTSKDTQSEAFHAGRTRIVAEAGAKVNLVQLQMINERSVHWNDVGVVVKENAQVEVVQIELGAKRALGGAFAVLEGEKASFTANTLYFGDGTRDMDFNYVAKHLGRSTNSEINAAGALFDECNKIYRGTIDFVRGSAHSKGAEKESTLLFSPKVRTRSAPLILCGEENVEGQHAASIGKIDAAKLFYLNTRGLSSNAAKRMMVQAQFEPILRKIPNEKLAKITRNFLAERMP